MEEILQKRINNINPKDISAGLTAIILTYNERLHIARCISNLKELTDNIIIVDSKSTDGTQDIARSLGATVIEHEWPGNQAAQFNWALDNLKFDTEWIIRIDADEYLLPELIEEIRNRLHAIPTGINGIVLKRRHIFLNKWMKRGIYPVKMLRLFRNGHGRYEQRMMDEHIKLLDGETIELKNDFCDHNLNNISWFCKKHVDYAIREAAEMLDTEYNLTGHAGIEEGLAEQANKKHQRKTAYVKKPLFWRSFAYFLYRYFLKGAWRDGKEGFIFTFIQGWWYRTLVDVKIFEIKKTCGNDPDKIKAFLKTEYNISF